MANREQEQVCIQNGTWIPHSRFSGQGEKSWQETEDCVCLGESKSNNMSNRQRIKLSLDDPLDACMECLCVCVKATV